MRQTDVYTHNLTRFPLLKSLYVNCKNQIEGEFEIMKREMRALDYLMLSQLTLINNILLFLLCYLYGCVYNRCSACCRLKVQHGFVPCLRKRDMEENSKRKSVSIMCNLTKCALCSL